MKHSLQDQVRQGMRLFCRVVVTAVRTSLFTVFTTSFNLFVNANATMNFKRFAAKAAATWLWTANRAPTLVRGSYHVFDTLRFSFQTSSGAWDLNSFFSTSWTIAVTLANFWWEDLDIAETGALESAHLVIILIVGRVTAATTAATTAAVARAWVIISRRAVVISVISIWVLHLIRILVRSTDSHANILIFNGRGLYVITH